MVSELDFDLKDYKIFCFNGKPKFIQLDYGRFFEYKRNFYDFYWKYIPAMLKYSTDMNYNIREPKKLSKMIELSKILSKALSFVRIDFYSYR